MLEAIWAQDSQGIIGNQDGKIPWNLPADMHHFVKITKGHTIVAGRKTFITFPKGGLPHRTNIVISHHSKDDFPDSVITFHHLKSFLAYEKLHTQEEIMVVGGASIYKALLPYAHYLFQTIINHHFKGTVKFPSVDFSKFKLIHHEHHNPDSHQNNYSYTFNTYVRK